MKRLIVILLAVLLCSCASNAAGDVTPPAPAAQDDSGVPAADDSVLIGEEIVVDDSFADNGDEELVRDYDQFGYADYDVSTLNFDSFAEFETFVYEGVPEEAFFPRVKEAEGTWKFNLQLRNNSYYSEIGFADFILDYDRQLYVLKLHPRLGQDGYEVWEENDDVGYMPFEGVFDDDGALKLIDGYNELIIYIRQYFAYSGREYMMGSIWISEEVSGDFWMYRGQE